MEDDTNTTLGQMLKVKSYLGTTSDVTKGGLLGLAAEIELHVEPVDDEDDEKY